MQAKAATACVLSTCQEDAPAPFWTVKLSVRPYNLDCSYTGCAAYTMADGAFHVRIWHCSAYPTMVAVHHRVTNVVANCSSQALLYKVSTIEMLGVHR